MNRLGRGLLIFACTSVIAVTASCGADRPVEKPADPVVDLSRLDVGNNPTTPHRYGKPENMEMAKLVESMRLGDSLPLPVEIDPAVKYPPIPLSRTAHSFIEIDTVAMKTRTNARLDLLNDQIKGLVCGFATMGSSDPTPNLAFTLDNVVMLYDTAQNAAAAADTLAGADFASRPDNAPVAIGEYPTARAHAAPGEPGIIRSWFATGRYVIFTFVQDNVMKILNSTDMPRLVSRVTESIGKISDSLQKFSPAQPDRLMDADVDPDGMLARALPTANTDTSQPGVPGYFTRRGGLQISPAPRKDAELFERTGVDRVSWRGGFVYRARDIVGAQTIAREKGEPTREFGRLEPPRDLPFALCREYRVPPAVKNRFYCSVSYDRYAAWVSSNQLNDVYQRISAQYALLANSH
ncbi:hypothetical protein [Nocardia terpenica]|uniref:Uncharacterized protein n=1 Tax=Nocardia terpenica TaxID=455432 RepID=A0A164I9D7_9NOCA|nr:hypothetical protein [Nocardia terpenica]KZM69221.1 hypothetical protein AWN90_16050 [Nocardia terpenica]